MKKAILLLAALGSAWLSSACGGSGAFEYEQDFDDAAQAEEEWPTGRGGADAVGGRYRIQEARGPQVVYVPLGVSVSVLEVEADAFTPTGSSEAYGIACWPEKDEAGYAFLVSGGDYGIVRTTRALVRGIAGESAQDVLAVADAGTELERKNQVRIRGVCDGASSEPTRLSMYVNGSLVVEAEDADGFDRFSWAGFVVSAGQGRTEFFFDNFAAREAEK